MCALNLNVREEYIKEATDLVEKEGYDGSMERDAKISIVALCLKYKFKYQFCNSNKTVLIYSIIDEWYFKYFSSSITLRHKNKVLTIDDYHRQKKFDNVVDVIDYIKSHDDYYYVIRTPREQRLLDEFETIKSERKKRKRKKKFK